jgi:APA family basic amino acid/polyamine antiporter
VQIRATLSALTDVSSNKNSRKTLGSMQLFALAFGAILGAGWIIAVGQWIAKAGPMGAVIGFLGGTVVLAFIALCYADLGTRYPETGGEVVYAQKLFGSAAAYYTGWFLAIVYIAVCAFSAISMGWILESLFPGYEGRVLYTILGEDIHIVGLLAGLASVVLVAVLSHIGLHATTTLQDSLMVLMVLAFLIFIAAGLFVGQISNLNPWFSRDPQGHLWPGAMQVFVTAPFWFSGFSVASQALGEKSDSTQQRRLGLVFLAAIGAAFLFYSLVVLVTAAALPRMELLALALPASGAFLRTLHSALFGKLILLTGLCGLLISLNAVFYSATRVLYSLGLAGLIPRSFATLNIRSGSPGVAVAFVTLLTLIGTLLGRGAIAPLVDSTSIILAGIYIMVCFGTVLARRRQKRSSSVIDSSEPGVGLPVVASILTVGLAAVALTTPWLGPGVRIPPEILLVVVAGIMGIAFRRLQQRSGN